MTKRVWSSELSQHHGERVSLCGWVYRKRYLKEIAFLVIRDGRGTFQTVVEDPESLQIAGKLTLETVLKIEGLVLPNPQAPDGVEITKPTITVLNAADSPLPLDLSKPTLTGSQATLLDHASLTLRHPSERAKHKLSAESVRAFRNVLNGLKFTEIQTPKIVGGATESGANVFRLDYFGTPAFLAQSPQLYKQIMVGIYERVYEVGPVFRAEPHATIRHLNEYVSLDVEMGFIQDHRDIMTLLAQVIRGIWQGLREHAKEELKICKVEEPHFPEIIPSLHFIEAKELLKKHTGEAGADELDLSPAQEKWLGEWCLREHNSDFLYVAGYPMANRPFYTHPQPDNPVFSNSFDLLFRGMELVTGGQRLHCHRDYRDTLQRLGIETEGLAGYLEAFRYGMPPHGGFGLGLERWIARLIGADNIRATTLFPRDRNRLFP